MSSAVDLADVLREFVKLDPGNPRHEARAYFLRERQRELMAPHTRALVIDREHEGVRIVHVIYGVDGNALR